MDREDITRMAREAGFVGFDGENKCLREFAALVIKPWVKQLEVERKKFQELNGIVTVAMQHARADEREACAKLCEEYETANDITATWLNIVADAIRARSKT